MHTRRVISLFVCMYADMLACPSECGTVSRAVLQVSSLVHLTGLELRFCDHPEVI